jgi:nitrogen fixation protein NifQ
MNAAMGVPGQYQRLMAGAADPADPVTLAFGGVLARFPILGLSVPTLERLLRRYFPRSTGLGAVASGANSAGCSALPADEFEDLRTLLMAHGGNDDEETQWLACTVATACLGDNHLWQDMGLPDRDTLSLLLKRHFTTLYEKNTGNMKWKKFFYKQLCEQAEVNLCKAPSCKVCADYALCFGPEVGGPSTR